jgi:hypothetical protein
MLENVCYCYCYCYLPQGTRRYAGTSESGTDGSRYKEYDRSVCLQASAGPILDFCRHKWPGRGLLRSERVGVAANKECACWGARALL